MIGRRFIFFFVLFVSSCALGIERQSEHIEKEMGKKSLLCNFCNEIILKILEFVLWVNPSLVRASNIFDGLYESKLIVLRNANNFSLTGKLFNQFKDEFPRIARKNVQSYMTKNWFQEFLSNNLDLDEKLKG